MKMEDHDWLDQRLASSEKYVADDGFAAKVAERLPQRRARAAVLRGWILFASIFAAVCLGALQIVPLVRDFERLALGKVPGRCPRLHGGPAAQSGGSQRRRRRRRRPRPRGHSDPAALGLKHAAACGGLDRRLWP